MDSPTRDAALLLLNLCTKRPRDGDDDNDSDDDGHKRHCINHVSKGIDSWTAPLPIIPQTQSIIPQGMALTLVDTVEVVSIKSASITEIPLENICPAANSNLLLVAPNKTAEPEPETIKPIVIRRNMVPAHKAAYSTIYARHSLFAYSFWFVYVRKGAKVIFPSSETTSSEAGILWLDSFGSLSLDNSSNATMLEVADVYTKLLLIYAAPGYEEEVTKFCMDLRTGLALNLAEPRPIAYETEEQSNACKALNQMMKRSGVTVNMGMAKQTGTRPFKGQYYSLHTGYVMDVDLAMLFRKGTTVQEALQGEGPELVINKRAGQLDDKW